MLRTHRPWKKHATRANESFAEAVAAEQQRHVQKIAAHAAAVVGRRQKGHVAAQGSQVADMIL
jgi:hypothetical protein